MADPALDRRITDFDEIIAIRHRLTHGYSSVNNDVVCSAIRHEAPLPLAQLKDLLDEAGDA